VPFLGRLNPSRDGTVESHPFDSAQGRLFREVRGRMGYPRIGEGSDKENKCGLGQPPGPHCYRGRSACRLSPGRKIIAQPHSRKCYAAMFP